MQIDATRINLYQHDIVSFAEDLYFIAPDETVRLWDFQKEILYHATRKNKSGEYKNKISIISLPRQNGKSELSTILGVHALFFGGWGHQTLTIGIGGKDTARVIFNKAKRALRHSPALFASIGDRNFLKDEITVPELETSWEIKASDVLSTIGRAYDLVLFDELGVERVQLNEGTQLYDSVTAGQAAKQNARIVITSTVGGEQGKMYDLIKLARTDEHIYCALRHDNPSPLITAEYLERRKRELHPQVYKHWHENRFFSGANTFITPDLYDSCTDPNTGPVPLMPRDIQTITWVDIGIKRDASVCVTVFRDAENRFRIAEIRSWSPQILKREIKLEWIEEYLIDAKERLNIKKIYIDQYQAQAMIQRHGKRLNLEGVHLTADKLERIWTNFITIMQNNEIMIYDDNSDDVRMMRQEALNLTISPKGAGFKVVDPGRIHQDRILALAGACWKMVEQYEGDRYSFGNFACHIQEITGHDVRCPLVHPQDAFLQVSCTRCNHFQYAFKLFCEVENVTPEPGEYFTYFDRVEQFTRRVGGFQIRGAFTGMRS